MKSWKYKKKLNKQGKEEVEWDGYFAGHFAHHRFLGSINWSPSTCRNCSSCRIAQKPSHLDQKEEVDGIDPWKEAGKRMKSPFDEPS